MWADVNFFAVIGAAIASFAVGALWHSPMLFGKQWMALAGFTPESMRLMPMGPKKAMTLGFLSTLIMSYVIAYFVVALIVITIPEALALGFWVWLGFIATTLVNPVLWQGESAKLYAFDITYQLVGVWVMAIILTLWQ